MAEAFYGRHASQDTKKNQLNPITGGNVDKNREGEQVNEKSQELIEEFEKHYREYVEAYPDQTDKNIIFQGWAIQKIAGLQLVVLELAQTINILTGGEAEITELAADDFLIEKQLEELKRVA